MWKGEKRFFFCWVVLIFLAHLSLLFEDVSFLLGHENGVCGIEGPVFHQLWRFMIGLRCFYFYFYFLWKASKTICKGYVT